MYRPFLLFSIVTTIVTALLILGLRFQIGFLKTDSFYTFICIYYGFAFVSMTILFLRDKKEILIRQYKFRNISLYVFTTPILLVMFSVYIMIYNEVKRESYSCRPLSDFKLCNLCIPDGTPVKVLYSSGGPSFNANSDFYYHYVVINTLSGDTLNVLTTFHSYVPSSNKQKIFSSQMSDITKLIHNLDQITDSTKTNIADLKLKEISKVIYDSKYDEFENNNYRTAIGELGEINK